MAGMINQLIDILGEQATRCEELLGLALEKKDVIIKDDIEQLQKITNLENMVINQNNRLERQRNDLLASIAEVLGKRGQIMDITALTEAMAGQAEQAPLREVGDRLREVLAKLKTANGTNRALIENALEYIDYSLNVIRTSAQLEGPEYPKHMQNEPISGTFDARQ
jgi:flagellar biosynthesis/type III secretory pathway chaperone